jgi:hypothetical protein
MSTPENIAAQGFELLSPQSHRTLRAQPTASRSHFAQIVISEFGAAATCCPVLFSKDAATGNFYAGAMFGFKPDEPILDSDARASTYRPLAFEREGFYISGEHISIDRRHARFSEDAGELLFDADSQPTVFLRQIQRTLGHLHAGVQATAEFIRALVDLKLIQPIDIAVEFDGGERLKLSGLYTVSLDALRGLDDAAVLRLFRSGYLHLAYTMIGSLKQIEVLARLRNKRRAASEPPPPGDKP